MPGIHFVSTEMWAGCHDGFYPGSMFGGEVFLLTSPFTEQRTTSHLTFDKEGDASSTLLP